LTSPGGYRGGVRTSTRGDGADGLDLPVAGAVVAEWVGLSSAMSRREPLFLAARLQAADRGVAAAGRLSGGALAWLPVDRDEARSPRVMHPRLQR
jgi:hypothetical protein